MSGNQVSTTPLLLLVVYEAAATECGATITPSVFSGNQFTGNVFRNPSPGILTGPQPRMSVNMPGSFVGGNLIQNNDFGTSDGPLLVPLTGFIDGGGNICGPLNPAVSNFICTGGGPEAHLSTAFGTPDHAWLWAPPSASAKGRVADKR
jgi:hypothetical protein